MNPIDIKIHQIKEIYCRRLTAIRWELRLTSIQTSEHSRKRLEWLKILQKRKNNSIMMIINLLKERRSHSKAISNQSNLNNGPKILEIKSDRTSSFLCIIRFLRNLIVGTSSISFFKKIRLFGLKYLFGLKSFSNW